MVMFAWKAFLWFFAYIVGLFDSVSFGFHILLRDSVLCAWVLESSLAGLGLTATMSSKELFLPVSSSALLLILTKC